MSLSVDELRKTVANLKNEGLNSQQIADELSLSQDTIAWLSSSNEGQEQPQDVRIGWRTIGVRPIRTEAMATIFADVLLEEVGEEGVDSIVGISLNGILFANEIAKFLDTEVSIHRNVDGGPGQGSLSNKYGQVNGKKIAIVDDVLSSGTTMRNTISTVSYTHLRAHET